MEEMLLPGERAEILGKDKIIIQSEDLYRFTSDAVALSRFVRIKSGDRLADLCSGCGIVGLHALYLHGEIASVTLFELQERLSDMARRTIEKNHEEKARAVCTKVQEIGSEYAGAFDVVTCNPPYFKVGAGDGKETESERLAKQEIAVTLREIVCAAAKCLRFGGRFAVCYPVGRLVELVTECRAAKIEPKRMKFLTKKEGGKPYLVLLEGTLGGKPGLIVENTEVNQCSTL